tara:strand:+ start:561 stop:1172 length:612 start_codon:yes stop_codon:yes gene_type:complete
MDEMEFNKIFAAILIAGITAMLTGFVAGKVVHPEKITADAYPIEVPEDLSALASSQQKEEVAEPILAMLAAASIEKGEKLSRACAACHSFDKGGPHRVGPNLWNVVNHTKGAQEGFSYSDALATDGGQWTYENLNKFLWKPKKTYPGTKMNYIGMKDPEDRADIVKWLRTLSDSPAPLPTAEEIAASQPQAEEDSTNTEADTE